MWFWPKAITPISYQKFHEKIIPSKMQYVHSTNLKLIGISCTESAMSLRQAQLDSTSYAMPIWSMTWQVDGCWGRTRTYAVSIVADLQSAAFATRRHPTSNFMRCNDQIAGSIFCCQTKSLLAHLLISICLQAQTTHFHLQSSSNLMMCFSGLRKLDHCQEDDICL